MPETDERDEVEQREIQGVLDEELNHLPSAYRDPLVLCYVQGKTHAEAAQILGCPVGSMSGRLSAAREKLRTRLNRRGLSTSAGLFGALLLASTARSEVPAALIRATVEAAAVAGKSSVVGAASRLVDRGQSMLRGTWVGLVIGVLAALLAILSVGGLIMQLVPRATADDARSTAVVSAGEDPNTGISPVVVGSPSEDRQAGREAQTPCAGRCCRK